MSSIDLRHLILMAASAAALSGCAGGSLKDAGGSMLTPTQQYAPKVEETPETLALAVHPAGVSETQRRAIAVFADKYRADGPGELTLRVPQSPAGAGGADNLTPTRMAAQVVTALESLGISRAHVRVAAYDPAADPVAPVVLSYLHYAVAAMDCSRTWNNVGATGSNKPTTNFGCSNTANFAAMVADPRDLLRPVPLDPSDNTRRQVVLGKYRQGELTSTQKDAQASGTVSKAVN